MHIKEANGKKTVSMSRREWQAIGKRAGWNKAASREEMTFDQGFYTSEDSKLLIATHPGGSDGVESWLPEVQISGRATINSIDSIDKLIAKLGEMKSFLSAGDEYMGADPLKRTEPF